LRQHRFLAITMLSFSQLVRLPLLVPDLMEIDLTRLLENPALESEMI
jgi:hypothetical protein